MKTMTTMSKSKMVKPATKRRAKPATKRPSVAAEVSALKKSVDDMISKVSMSLKNVDDCVSIMNAYIAINTKTSPSICWQHIMFTLLVVSASANVLQFFFSARTCTLIYAIAAIVFGTAFFVLYFSSGNQKL